MDLRTLFSLRAFYEEADLRLLEKHAALSSRKEAMSRLLPESRPSGDPPLERLIAGQRVRDLVKHGSPQGQRDALRHLAAQDAPEAVRRMMKTADLSTPIGRGAAIREAAILYSIGDSWRGMQKQARELTTAGRNRVKTKNFALPGRRYPVEDTRHARNALSRVSQFGSPRERAAVRAKVHRKFPGIGDDSEKSAGVTLRVPGMPQLTPPPNPTVKATALPSPRYPNLPGPTLGTRLSLETVADNVRPKGLPKAAGLRTLWGGLVRGLGRASTGIQQARKSPVGKAVTYGVIPAALFAGGVHLGRKSMEAAKQWEEDEQRYYDALGPRGRAADYVANEGI